MERHLKNLGEARSEDGGGGGPGTCRSNVIPLRGSKLHALPSQLPLSPALSQLLSKQNL